MYTAALIGTGRIGFSLGFDKKREQPASHTMALLYNKNIKIAAGCDCSEENLSEWKKYVDKKQKSDVKIFASSDELFNNLKTDIVVVAVNEESHLCECIKAIESKPRLVILEKPVALSVEEGEKIKVASEKFNVPVLVNHERRFSLDYNLAKQMLAEGKIGKLQTVNGRLFSGMRVYSKLRESNGAYSLLHDGTHLVDIVSFLLDDEKIENLSLTGLFWEPVKDETEPSLRNLTAHYTTKSCPDVNLYVSGRSRYFEFGVELLGTEGRIFIGNGIFTLEQRKESKLYTGFYSLEKVKFSRPKKTYYFANMVQNAVDFLEGRSEIKSPLSVALNDLRILIEIKDRLQ